jgi:hypothetical protein
MTGPDASWHEMPGFTLPGWLGRDADEQLLDTILAGMPLPPSAPREYHVVAEQLADLATPAGPGPLPGETAALAAFSSSVSSGSLSPAAAGARAFGARTAGADLTGAVPGDARGRSGTRRRGLLTTGRARLAAAVTAVGLVLGTTAAAYAGALPAQVQDFAHRMIGAPAAHHSVGHPHPALTQRPGRQHVQPAAHPSHQPPGQQRDRTPPGHAKGHQKHPKRPRPGRTPKLPGPGHGGHQPG